MKKTKAQALTKVLVSQLLIDVINCLGKLSPKDKRYEMKTAPENENYSDKAIIEL